MKLGTAIILNFPEELLSHQMRTKKRKEEKKNIRFAQSSNPLQPLFNY